MWAVSKLGYSLALLAVVEEDFIIRSYTGEMVSRGSVAKVLNELCMRLDSLCSTVLSIDVNTGRKSLATFSYLYGAPWWKTIVVSSPPVTARYGLWWRIDTALTVYDRLLSI